MGKLATKETPCAHSAVHAGACPLFSVVQLHACLCPQADLSPPLSALRQLPRLPALYTCSSELCGRLRGVTHCFWRWRMQRSRSNAVTLSNMQHACASAHDSSCAI